MSMLHVVAREWLIVLASLVGLGALVGLGELLRAQGVAARTTRRLVHTGVSLFVGATPFLFTRPLPVYGLAAVFTLLNADARFRGKWPGIHEARPESWGTVALPLSVLPALAATWSVSPDRILAFQLAYLVLALADSAASWVGERSSTTGSQSPECTVTGSLTFAGLTLSLTLLVLATRTEWSAGRVLVGAGGATIMTPLVEAVSRRGWDNFFIVVALLLVLVPVQMRTLSPEQLGGALVVGAVFGGLAYAADALDGRGAATGGLFAASLVGLGGGPWIVPGIVFFGVSSALTGVEGWMQASSQAVDAPRRTQAQVLANGGVAWTALAVVALEPSGSPGASVAGYAAFVGALAAAAADTWATELGSLSPSLPWSLRSLQQVPTGTSGAISLVGCGAAALGAASVVGAALVSGGAVADPVGRNAALLLGAGLAGMLADSAAGAFLQAQYRAPSGTLIETPPSKGDHPVRGWAGVGNNVVNFIGTAVGALTALAGIVLGT
ncbi:MAG: DUF92 domain-containing protein [Bacteroidetes bacterium QH_2_63_10]|nr:MAG: DUF92 domain-containing protein [Bacteroidetes bacterium QH_2_63_10]